MVVFKIALVCINFACLIMLCVRLNRISKIIREPQAIIERRNKTIEELTDIIERQDETIKELTVAGKAALEEYNALKDQLARLEGQE